MRTLIPFTARHPKTIAGAPADAEWRYVGGDDHAYWRVMCEFWAYGEDLTVIEHDVIARPDVMVSFAECSEPWCAFGYDDICHPLILHADGSVDGGCMEAWANTLGCTRFRKELIAFVRDTVKPGATVYTDALGSYRSLPDDGYVHAFVDHVECYVEGRVHTNGIENFWSLLKRSLHGTYVAVNPEHLFRYVDERVFSFNLRGLNDYDRFRTVLQHVTGRRLTYAELTGN